MMARRIDPELFRLSRDYVGDTAETVALIWPRSCRLRTSRPGERRPTQPSPRRSTDASPRRHRRRAGADRPQRPGPRLETWLDALDATGRWALLKLLTGALRVGVSARLAKTALAEMAGFDVDEIEEVWHALAPPYEPLFAWLEGRGAAGPTSPNAPVFRPLMLSHPLEDADWAGARPRRVLRRMEMGRHPRADRGRPRRGAALSRAPATTSPRAFPTSSTASRFDAVLDGELLVVRDGEVAPFNDLQQRLNRKAVTQAAAASSIPAHVRLYDAC